MGYVTTYAYDPLDDLTRVNHQSGLVRTFSYDYLKRLTSAANPESGTMQYNSYDGNGNLLRKTDARGIQTNLTYDELNRVKTKLYSDGTPGVTYTYDDAAVAFSVGRLTKVLSSASTSQVLGYDALGRPISSSQTTGGQSYGFSYVFNLAGKLTSEAYPSGRTVIAQYDFAARPSSVSGTSTNYASSIGYGSQSAITQMTLGNTLVEQTCYNNRLQPIGIRLGTAGTTNCVNSGSDVLNLGYTFGTTNNNGNVQTQTIAVPGMSSITQSYTYDGVNRIQAFSETGSQANQNYSYDSNGNRWVGSGWIPYPGQTPTNNNFPNNQWAAGSGVSYDPAGNQTGITSPSRTLAYDAENRQTTAVVNGVTNTYVYDGDGRRVTKTVGTFGPSTVFVYDVAGHLTAEYGGPTNPLTGTTYLTDDHLGSTRMVTNASGAVVSRFDYAPFGEELTVGIDGRVAPYSTNQYPTATLDGTSEKFTSKERDAETGLDFFGARYFSGAQGRFTGIDPELIPRDFNNPQIWNRYAYALNNPLRFVDPDGAAVIDAGTIQLGTAAFKVYQQQGQSFDLAASLSTIFPLQTGSPLNSINRNLEQFEQNKSSFLYPAQNNAGGCPLGCTGTFAEQGLGVTLNLSFNYDKSDNLTGANITATIDRNATFIGPNPPSTVTFNTFLAGTGPPAQMMRVDVNSSALQSLTPQQLQALAKAAANVPVGEVRDALTSAISKEQKRRAELKEQGK